MQLRAMPVLRASSKAKRFITGRLPGRPRQTGQVCTLGCVGLKRLRQPQKSLVCVSSCTCTSSPMTVV